MYVDENQRRIVEKEIFPFSESFFLEDFLAAFSIARFLNVPREIILKNVKYLKPSPMRFEKIVKDDVLFINDTYNASPISVKMAIQNFPISQRSGRKILVLGSMKELGEKSNKIHQEILDVAVRDFDFTLLLGSEFEALVRGDVYENVFVFNEKEALISKLEKIVFKGSVVLIKGARFHKMEKIVDHFLK